jgi:hypothetical protein
LQYFSIMSENSNVLETECKLLKHVTTHICLGFALSFSCSKPAQTRPQRAAALENRSVAAIAEHQQQIADYHSAIITVPVYRIKWRKACSAWQ